MSEKSLDNQENKEAKVSKPHEKKRQQYQWKMLAILPLWVGGAFLASNLVLAAVILILNWFHISLETFLRPAILQTVLAILIYVMTIAIVIVVPYKLGNRTDLKTLGLQRLPSWADIGLTP